MAGAVLCTLKARLDSSMVSVLLDHSEAKIVFIDYKLLEIARGALDLLAKTNTKPPVLVLIREWDDSSPTKFVGTVEVETILYGHQAVLEVAVVARPDNHWGQTPCAFVKLKQGFEELPRTSTGKDTEVYIERKSKSHSQPLIMYYLEFLKAANYLSMLH
ncbi:hypothetical protein PTKIN_Ptkin08bG0204300 [Pterospermum kingtungense]